MDDINRISAQHGYFTPLRIMTPKQIVEELESKIESTAESQKTETDTPQPD
jgi:hypothetical protein